MGILHNKFKLINNFLFIFIFLSLEADEIKPENQTVKNWYKAVKEGNGKKAIKYAEKEVTDIESINRYNRYDYSSFLKKTSFKKAYLKGPFNWFDYKLWKDAYAFKLLAEKIIQIKNGNISNLQALFYAVSNNLESKSIPDKKNLVVWPSTIWQNKKGMCDQQAWVLCELAYQAGYDAYLFYLYDKDFSTSPHTICEIRSHNEKEKYVCDPYSDIFVSGYSIPELAEKKKILKKIWPSNKNFQNCLKQGVYIIPSYPQDYKYKNQILREKIKSVLGQKCPKFAEQPELRLKKIKNIIKNENIDTKKYLTRLWPYPFRLLRKQLIINSKHKNGENKNESH